MNTSPFLSRWPEHRAVPGGGPRHHRYAARGKGLREAAPTWIASTPRPARLPRPPLSGEGVHIGKSALTEGRGPFKLAYRMRD